MILANIGPLEGLLGSFGGYQRGAAVEERGWLGNGSLTDTGLCALEGPTET